MNLPGHSRLPAGPMLAALLVLGFLALFLVVPVGTVFYSAFVNADGGFTIGHFGAFFNQPLMLEAFFNSLYVAGWSALLASLIAVPLAYFTVRFDFRGALIIQTLGVLPLIMPPFVGAVAMQLIFGRSGSVNLLLDDWFGVTIPFMEGLNGVIFVQSVHYFPFILINLSAALRNVDRAMEEAAQNLGADAPRVFRDIILPLLRPAFISSLSYTFVRSMTAVSAVIFLISARWYHVTVLIYNFSENLRFGLASVLATALIVIVLAAMGLMRLLVGRNRNLDKTLLSR